MHPQFTEALFAITKTWKQHKCTSIDEWIKKMLHKHTMGYFSVIKEKERNPAVTTLMSLEGIMLREMKQRQIVYDFTYMGNLNLKTNQHMHRHRQQVGGYQSREHEMTAGGNKLQVSSYLKKKSLGDARYNMMTIGNN